MTRAFEYYQNLASNLVIGPLVFFLLIAIVYNVFVGIATWWMYKHACSKSQVKSLKTEVGDSDMEMLNPTDPVSGETSESDTAAEDQTASDSIFGTLHTSMWEEIFVKNIKLAQYLLGSFVKLKDFDKCILLKIHDYAVFMPLAIVFIQVCEVAVVVALIVIFVDNLIIEVSHSCTPKHDCYSDDDLTSSSLPLNCSNDNMTLDINLTCFRLTFNPVFAISIAGGFLKTVPYVLFTTVTYSYLKVHEYVHKAIEKRHVFSKVITIGITHLALFAIGAIIVAIVSSTVPLKSLSFDIANPLGRLRNITLVVMYFVISSFLWCIHPESKAPIRYQNSEWKKTVTKNYQQKQTLTKELKLRKKEPTKKQTK